MSSLELIQQLYAYGFTGAVPHDCRPVEHVELSTDCARIDHGPMEFNSGWEQR